MIVIGGRGGIIPATPGSANMAAPLRPALRAGSQTEDPTRFSIVESDSSGGRGGIIWPAASSASLASPGEPRWRAWQSNCVLIPPAGQDNLAALASGGRGGIISPAASSASLASPGEPRWRAWQSNCVLIPPAGQDNLAALASGGRGGGFEPTEQSPVRSISSRVPSTGLSHPSIDLNS